ncbi:TetR/AcrR family transcriptional regulator [Vineibacter terrae]|uniref:TetR/AcrR family transcriptional regulator n=1 Tax=Vineibacter terrae TaxID=2586908 RepID=UPI002E2F6691|nr:TetR/AcrR family transcriptional regulator [Vineibacter terrae]HEX2888521.1 TetR/AcrR family transcriptional regulator [Vineibacter terrae]
MRRSKEETAETRRRIIETAAREFRTHGIAGVGIAELMARSELTHGGFYRHFASKDALAAEACRAALGETTGQIAAAADKAPQGRGLETVLRRYLNKLHRDTPEKGCSLAAIGSEAARGDGDVRAAMTEGYLSLVATVRRQLTGLPAAEAEDRALAIVAGMIGCLTMARLVDDEDLSNRILRAGRQHLAGSG